MGYTSTPTSSRQAVPVLPLASATEAAQWTRSWTAAAVLLIAVVSAMYAYPFLMVRREFGPQPLPPLFTPDTYLYFTLDHAGAHGSALVNPWYGFDVPRSAAQYSKFPGAFLCLRFAEAVFGLPADTLLPWTLIWLLASAACGWWLLRKVLPRAPALTLCFLALFLLVDLLQLPEVLSAWLRAPHSFALGFPFLRLLYPQTVIPLVTAYAALQIQALEGKNRAWWPMGAIQLATAATFPYATLYLAALTAVALAYVWSKNTGPSILRVAAFAAACGIADLILLSAMGSLSGPQGTGVDVARSAALATLLFSKKFLLLAALVIVVAVTNGARREIKAVVLGCGVAACLLLLGDGVFPLSMQVSHHAMYFVHTTLTLIVAHLSYVALDGGRRPWLRNSFAALLLVFALAHGVLVSRATYVENRNFNREQASALRALQTAQAGAEDLVIARATWVDDTACWIPLMTGARVLFCRNAEMLMTAEQMASAEGERFGLYLYFRGADEGWVRRAVASPSAALANGMVRISERLPLQEDRHPDVILKRIETEAESRLGAAATGNAVQALLGSYQRILLVDSAAHPSFSAARLDTFLQASSESTAGDSVVRVYRLRPLPPTAPGERK